MVLSALKRRKLQRFIQNRSSHRNFKGYFTESCSLSRVLSTLVMGEKSCLTCCGRNVACISTMNRISLYLLLLPSNTDCANGSRESTVQP